MKLSAYSWVGYGFLVATLFGISKYGIKDYAVMGLFILTVSLLLVDVIKYYKLRDKK